MSEPSGPASVCFAWRQIGRSADVVRPGRDHRAPIRRRSRSSTGGAFVPTGSRPGFPASRLGGITTELTDEAHLSAEPIGSQTPARISRPHGDKGWPQGDQPPAGTRAQAAFRLTSDQNARAGTLIGEPAKTACERGTTTARTTTALARMTRRPDYLRAARGRKAVTRGFVLQSYRRPPDDLVASDAPRVGFTVSRKVGDAVVRNRVRRRLKEAMRAVGPRAARTGHDYVMVGRHGAIALPFRDLLGDLERAFRKVHAASAKQRRSNADHATSRTSRNGSNG